MLMKKILLLTLVALNVATLSAQNGFWRRTHKMAEPTVCVISLKQTDTSLTQNPALALQHIALQHNRMSRAATESHKAAHRAGFQSVDAPNIIFTNAKNSFSLAVGGYVALRASYSFDNAVQNIDMVPYDVPIIGSYASRQALGMDATTSRLYMRAIIHPKRFQMPVTVYFDTDFRGGAEGSYTPRLRSAYVSVAGFTFGRDVTTFCDLTAAPTTIDFQGPNAYNFNFATMIRYERSFLDNHLRAGIAAEMPVVSGSYGETLLPVPQRVPDFPMYVEYLWGKYRQSHIRASAVLRNMYLYNNARQTTTDLFGWGVQLSGNIHITKMLQLFMNGTYGEGITPYIQDLTGSGLDFTPNPADNSRVQTMPMFGWQIAAQVNLSPTLFISGGYSMVQVQHKNGYYSDNQYNRGQYAFGNIFYSVTARFKIAAEYLWAARKNMDGQHNHANRINILFKYSF